MPQKRTTKPKDAPILFLYMIYAIHVSPCEVLDAKLEVIYRYHVLSMECAPPMVTFVL